MSSAIQIWGGIRNETELGTGKLLVSSRTSIMHINSSIKGCGRITDEITC